MSRWLCGGVGVSGGGYENISTYRQQPQLMRREVVYGVQHPVLVVEQVDLEEQPHGLGSSAPHYGLMAVLPAREQGHDVICQTMEHLDEGLVVRLLCGVLLERKARHAAQAPEGVADFVLYVSRLLLQRVDSRQRQARVRPLHGHAA